MFTVRRLLLQRSFMNAITTYEKLLLSTSKIDLNKPHHVTQTSQKPESSRLSLVSHSNEQQFLASISSDADTFGNTAFVATEDLNDPDEDPGDVKEDEYLTSTKPQKLRTKQYAEMIKGFIRKKKIKEAIDVLEMRMLKEDKVQPENYIYNLLLGGCGRVGYTKKAFSLFNVMKKRGLAPTGGTYTALFNACANSPWPADGLSRAQHLRTLLQEQSYRPNDTTYNAMIKAFGRCGDLRTAFSLADERTAAGYRLGDDTCNFLLQACVADTEAGFRHALLVWRRMRSGGVAPSVFTFNLMLRCLRECGLGDISVMEELLKKMLPETDRYWAKDSEQIESGAEVQSLVLTEPIEPTEPTFYDPTPNSPPVTLKPTTINANNTPDLLAYPHTHLGDIIALGAVSHAPDRLLLLGGCAGYLRTMRSLDCAPDVRTYTLLLDSVPATAAAEDELLDEMKRDRVVPDVEWCNVLIKRRSMRFEYELAQDVLTMMKKRGMRPDLITYGVLALGCKTKEEAESLLAKMMQAKYRLNTEILGAMLHQAGHHTNIEYVIWILDTTLSMEIKPNKAFMQHLEKFKKKCRYISNDRTNPLSTKKQFINGHNAFKLRYKSFVRDTEVVDEDSQNPWQQFRQTSDTDVQHVQDKEARFKPRHSSLFGQKTSLKWSKAEKIPFWKPKGKTVHREKKL